MSEQKRAHRGWEIFLGSIACILLVLNLKTLPLHGDRPAEVNDTPGVGFTVAAPGDDPDLVEFRADVDRILEGGGTWIRFGVRAEIVVAQWGADSGVRFDNSGLETVARAAEYARERGLAVYLISADGDPRGVSATEYERSMRAYWQGLAQAFVGNVAVWQIFNEPDGLHYQSHTEIPAGQRGAYYAELGAQLEIANQIFGSFDPDALITTNVSGYPIGPDTAQYWHEFFDATAPGLDVLGVSAYPQLDPHALERLPDLINDIEEHYGKPVVVAEVGLQTCAQCFTPAQQGQGVSKAVETLITAEPLAVLVYRLRDEEGGAEPDFGVLYSDGQPKTGASEIFDSFPTD